jgi:hypothetical protein
MPRRRCHRLTITFFVVMSLLFSQLALASYVCPGQAQVHAMADDGGPCDGVDPAQPVLCHQHCSDPAKNVEAVKLPVAAPPAVAQVLEWPPVLEADATLGLPSAAAVQARPPPDPIFLSTLRLRV